MHMSLIFKESMQMHPSCCNHMSTMQVCTVCALDMSPGLWVAQVLDNSLEAHVMSSDNSSLAKDCRKDIKAANARLLKLGRKVVLLSHPCK